MSNTTLPTEEQNKQPSEQPKQKKVKIKKYKLTVMDYITIGFTAVIVLIMVFILLRTIRPDWFQSSKQNNGQPSASMSATEEPSSDPTLSDNGNTYGNFSNSPCIAEIDDRLYFVSAGDDAKPYLYVKAEGETRKLVQDNVFCLNVISDPFTYADDAKAYAYTVFYLDADGNICCVTDGPVYSDAPFMENVVEKRIYKEGAYKSIAVRGEYLFFIDKDGHVGKMSLIEEAYTVLSKESYKALSVYGTSIFAQHEDGTIYLLSTVARPVSTPTPTQDPSASPEATATATPAPTETATPVPGVDEYEIQILTEKVTHFCVDGSYLYTVSDSGIVRRSGDGTMKDTLSKRKAEYINVLDGQIFVVSQGTLYVGTAAQYVSGTEVAIGSVSSSIGISLTEDAVYVYAGGLKVSTYDKETDKYSALTKVTLPA
ncbi:MAG: hypothetical protein J6L76_03690 [Clostridia bacterium]|nr:hypothetical protein [Clostridia bacterium]